MLDNGIVCDETLLAAPGIVAAGDVARWPNPLFDGEVMRLEHWTNATEQGVAAARRCGSSSIRSEGDEPEAYAPVPFVWSDQYDRKIQTVGHFRGDDEMEVVYGTLDERRFVAVFGRNDRLVGALGFSMPAKVMQYRKMIEERADVRRRPSNAHARREPTARDTREPLLTRRFVVVVLSGVFYFLAIGACCRWCRATSTSSSAATTSPSASRWVRWRSARSCCDRSPGAWATGSDGGC